MYLRSLCIFCLDNAIISNNNESEISPQNIGNKTDQNFTDKTQQNVSDVKHSINNETPPNIGDATQPSLDSNPSGEAVCDVNMTLPGTKRCVSLFGSFTAQFDDGLSLAYSVHGPSGQAPDGEFC